MIKFVTGFSGFGGSTVMIIQHAKLLQEKGYEVEIYGAEDWHMDKFSGSKKLKDLSYSEDDIILFHYYTPNFKIKCKKCFLYLQETNLFDLREKDLSLFDEVLFVSEGQMNYHGFEKGRILPNRINGLVDLSKNKPPGQNIAGIIGHIHPIKQPHVAIKKALEDNVSKIFLYGIICLPYFEKEIQPFLSEKVVYGGAIPLESKMEMYNSFDILYHFGEFESACLAWAEAHVLGKKIVKSEKLYEYPILDDHEVLEVWKTIIE
jgi:hypothetical protein